MANSFAAEWKSIKETFEKNTKQKKPSAGFMGVFSKASGLTPATVAFDKAYYDQKIPEMQKLLGDLKKTAQEYMKTLDKAATGDKPIVDDLKKMRGRIAELVERAETEVLKEVNLREETSGKNATCPPRPDSLAQLLTYMKNRKFQEILIGFLKSTHSVSNLEFLLKMAQRDYSLKTYHAYISPSSKVQVDLPSAILNRFDLENIEEGPWAEATNSILADLKNDTWMRLTPYAKAKGLSFA